MRTYSALVIVSLLLAACGHGAGAPQQGSADEEPGVFWQGVTISCYRNGPGEWDGPEMQPTLDHLVTLGVDAVAIHPYAQIRNDGAVRYNPGRAASATLRPIAWANERGMTSFLKPHLAYWGSGFAWRGVIQFEQAAQWDRFFEQYTLFIVDQARLAEQAGADLFAVGTELHKTLGHEAQWRAVIAAVKAVYHGKLTYAANWDEVDDVPFWDALDYVGVQFYYPLVKGLSPGDEALRAGMRRRLDELAAAAKRYGKPVVLTELGYAQSEAAASKPWSDQLVGDSEAAAELKLRCMRIALETLREEPSVVGVFLWKWFPGKRNHADEFVLQYDAMRQVIRGAWGDGDSAPRPDGQG